MTGRYAQLAPGLLRLGLGAVFLVHGLAKLFDLEAATAFFTEVGLPAPAIMAVLIGVLEAAGGAALLLGLFTQVAAGVLALNMLGAMATVKFEMGFVNGWEFDLVLFTAALSLVLSGPGVLVRRPEI